MFGNKSIEQRLAALTTACREALNIPEATEITGDIITASVTTLRESATASANESATTLSALQATVRAALHLAADAEITADILTAAVASAVATATKSATEALSTLGALCRDQLALEAGVEITADSFAAALTALVNTRAAAIAAAQGVPPLPGKPGASATPEEDPIKAAFTAAQECADPAKRSLLFAAANALVRKSKK